MYPGALNGRAPVGPGLGAVSLPSWLTTIVGAVVKGRQVSVPTPSGTVIVNLDDSAQLTALYNMLKGTKLTTRRDDYGAAPGGSVVDSIPGGWLTIAGVGVALFMLTRRRG